MKKLNVDFEISEPNKEPLNFKQLIEGLDEELEIYSQLEDELKKLEF